MKKILLYLVTLTLTIFAVACGNKPNEPETPTEKTNAELIVGSWLLDMAQLNDMDITEDVTEVGDYTMTYNADGTGTFFNDNEVQASFTYTVDGTKLVEKWPGEQYVETIEQLDETTFIYSYSNMGDAIVMKFHRVNNQ